MDTPQTHYEKLVEVTEQLKQLILKMEEKKIYRVYNDLVDHLLYYDSLTSPSS